MTAVPLSKSPIGASMVDFIHRSSLSPEESDPNIGFPIEQDIQVKRPSPLLSLEGVSANNMLLRGPRQSGRSSFLMDMAQSLALKHMCRGHCLMVGNSCHCVAVSLIVPVIQGDNEDNRFEKPFPLPVVSAPQEPCSDFASQMRALEPGPARPTWEAAALRRVQVHHVVSLRDAMEILLNVQARPAKEQPWNGIFIDNVDWLARIERTNAVPSSNVNHTPELSTPELMNMTQMLALLADTGNVLRQHGAHSLTVAATIETGIPAPVEQIYSSWFPTLLQLYQGHTWKPLLDENGETVNSCWTIERVDGFAHTSRKTRSAHSELVVRYATISSPDGPSHIVWELSSK